jgi:carbamoyl-phosphate synthase large subunit
MNTHKKRVLVTGVGGPAGINSVRLLREQPDVYVIGCDIDPLAAGQSFVDEFLLCPRVTETATYRHWLDSTCLEKAVTLVIPTVHEELPVLAQHEFAAGISVVLSGSHSIELGADKTKLYAWAMEHLADNAIPWVLIADWTPDWRRDEVQFIKPRAGRGARGCRTITKSELQREQAYLSADTIVMAYMPGTEWTVDAYVSQRGDLIYAVPRERIGLAGGISIKGKTVKHPALESLSKTVANALDCRGPVCIQWRADDTGVPRLIEINPRLSGGLPITVAAGVNPLALILAEAAGEQVSPQSWEEVTVVGHFEYIKL